MSALEGFANATIKIATQIGYESDGFNDVPVMGTLELRATLSKPKGETQIKAMPGIDISTVAYKGNLVSPLPSEVRLPKPVSVVFDFTEREEQFNLLWVMPSAYYDEVDTLGQPIALSEIG